ncbi:MAG: transglutaminase family protein [Polyangiales bacterium]
MRGEVDPFLEAVRAHDALLEGRGLSIWIGAEPTFTRADSQEPWWHFQAEGGDKQERAALLASAFAGSVGGAVKQEQGRQYPDEAAPRFCIGVQWSERRLTVTPDPGVVEVNMAPEPTLTGFLAQARAIDAAARAAGLSARRHRFNGDVADSGGGGQITLGGKTPDESPFFRTPHLLPGLLRYFNRHPSLSYAFATECVGSASQGPRPDEGARERFEELAVALEALDRKPATHEALWASLAPLLVDGAGNSHRAELNIEKLWNTQFLERGTLGVVEFRALRMQPTPERMTAIAMLLRSIAARVTATPFAEPLIDWGSALHDLHALPTVLEDDLRDVLDDLRTHGFGIAPHVEAMLLEPRDPIVEVRLAPATLTVRKALEFWPLVGDVASQERSSARLVDASSERFEIVIRVPAGALPGTLGAHGIALPMADAGERDGTTRFVAAVRRRAFVPSPGLHPSVAAEDPLHLHWSLGDRAIDIDLHAWIPGGGVYDGLPHDDEEAERRRRERVIVRDVESVEPLGVPAGRDSLVRTPVPLRSLFVRAGGHLGIGLLVDLRRERP